MEQDFHLASCILVLGASRFLPLGSCFLKNLVSWLLYLASRNVFAFGLNHLYSTREGVFYREEYSPSSGKSLAGSLLDFLSNCSF